MKSICNAIKLQFNEQGKPELVISLSCTRQEIMPEVQELRDVLAKGKLLAVEVKQYRKGRSLDSNSYLWTMCNKLAEKLSTPKSPITKDDVYREAIRKVGQFEYLAVAEDAAEQFIKVWNSRGLGWYAEEMDSKIPGCKKIIAYYGSSVYDTKAMSVLVDYVVEECKENGIETLTPQELAAMNEKWGK